MLAHPIAHILHDLECARNPLSQLSVLRCLKHELVGHELRKRESIRHGIVRILASILEHLPTQNDKHVTREGGILAGQTSADASLLINATSIVGILAHGGPSIVRLVLQSSIPQQLLAHLSFISCHPRAANAILKCLNTIADQSPPAGPSQWVRDRQLARLLYAPSNASCLERLIRETTPTRLSQSTCNLTLRLICTTCTEEKQKKALADAGVLNALSIRLASFIVAEGLVFPILERSNSGSPTSRHLPLPTARSRLSIVLRCIAMMIERSSVRAHQILLSPAITMVLPRSYDEAAPKEQKREPWGAQLSTAVLPRSMSQNPIDALLPLVPKSPASLAVEQSSFPPLGSVAAAPKRRPSFLRSNGEGKTAGLSTQNETEEDESPLIALLLFLVHERPGLCRLMAAKVLVCLFNGGLVKKSRTHSLSVLLVPVLVRMLDEYVCSEEDDTCNVDMETCGSLVKVETPAVLAALVMDDQDLQRAAVVAGAIQRLSQALKTTFDPLNSGNGSLWSPRSAAEPQVAGDSQDQLSEESGPSPSLRTRMSYREGLLKALAAIAPFNDEYRKAICDQGVVPCIIESLKPISVPRLASCAIKHWDLNSGNPAATLLAACGATRALTRSVTALRTNLIDAGIAPPILTLLSSGDAEIKIAATRVVANLAMDVSPMKETVSHQSVIKALCEQAHSANARLRFESVWALKQIVLGASNALKISVIQELGPSWIKHLIQTDPADIPPGVVIGMEDMEFPPRTNFFAGLTSASGDTHMCDTQSTHKPDMTPAERWQLDDPVSTYEEDPNKHTVEDDTAIQEQLLDFLRNLSCGQTASEIIDYLFAEMGQMDFFDIMLARLRPRIIPGATRKENRSIAPTIGIVTKVMYIVVHIAASVSRMRNTIASTPDLLRQILAYCTHPSPEIRAQCCWIAINLTYEDDPSDRHACKKRALQLDKAGFLPKLTAMFKDEDVDVKERSKTAVHLIRQLLF